MEINYGNFAMVVGGLLTYPDFAFNPTPKQPSQIKESMFIQGSTAGSSVGMQGTSDSE